MIADGFHDVPPGKVAMIVTHLEMTSRADTRQIPLPEGVSFHKVDARPEWYRDVFRRVGSQDWLWYGRLRKNDAELMDILGDPGVEVFTLRHDGHDEALLELDFRVPGECELAYFGLTAALIGTGSGRYLMNEAITRAWAKPITRFHVHTCTIDSPQALAFYRRSGFTPCRQQVEIDDDPRVIGVLPEDHGPNVPIFRAQK
ncbi:GNAT family N-acetyltransferase [uncultured Roseobacter sp.]|uniref:GNAT family N-acetyltransferase n=1 Tax=uncultured Roseobacter sp. TaxID=114847 RepID=UPI0026080B6F|nr:GNAT family N-acetyltransferase [uncultured Roseobacter sp.]